MRKIGYARVSSADQNLDRQIAALRAEGCDEIYREKASGKSLHGRPRGCLVKVLDRSYLDLTTAVGLGIIAFLSALAEDERKRILRRCSEGTAAAKKNGVKFGRKPKLTDPQREEAQRRLETGESARSIARIMGVHHATVLGAARPAPQTERT